MDLEPEWLLRLVGNLLPEEELKDVHPYQLNF